MRRVSTTGGKAMKWEGVPQMRALFAEFAIALGEDGLGEKRRELKDILIKPAFVMRDEIRDLVPVRTGRLRNAIFASRGREDKPGVIIGVNAKEAPYGRFVERGTSKMVAQPFFRPGITATAPSVANLISGDMKKLIEGMANELKYRPSK